MILESIRQRPSPQCTCDLGKERGPNNWNEEGENMGRVERAVSALPSCNSEAVRGAWYTLAPADVQGMRGRDLGHYLASLIWNGFYTPVKTESRAQHLSAPPSSYTGMPAKP